MLIDDSTKKDIIKVLEDVIDPGMLDYDSEWEQRLCNFCYGGSETRLQQKSENENPEAFEVKHTEDCAITVARRLLPILKGEDNAKE